MSAKVVAKYHTMTRNEQNKYWIKEHEVSIDNIDMKTRILMEYYSRCVDLYIKSSKEEQEFLWRVYDWMTRFFCDRAKWRKQYNKMIIYKNDLEIAYPNQPDYYYNHLLKQRDY
jgi:hypothetical protein